MARYEADVTITDEGRDKGNVYHIVEMSAWNAERWAMRVLMAVAKSGKDIGELDSITGSGMAGIAMLGAKALFAMDFDEAEPLLAEMMTCVSINPSPTVNRPLMEDDIQEVQTLFRLRKEVLDLHLRFLKAGAPSKSTSETSATPQASSNTQTSPDPAVRFSHSPRTRQPR